MSEVSPQKLVRRPINHLLTFLAPIFEDGDELPVLEQEAEPSDYEWQMAIQLFPDLQAQIKTHGTIGHFLYFEIFPRCLNAHSSGDVEELEKIYGYVDWCFHRENLVSDALGGFYERLVDWPVTREQIPIWLRSDVFDVACVYYERWLPPAAFIQLKKDYSEQHA